MSQLQRKLEHSRAAYRFALHSIPSNRSVFPLDCNGYRFESLSQIQSMIIEFGWAYFCRYEACLEAYIKSKNIQLSRGLSLGEWFNIQKINVPPSYEDGLFLYRQIRNKLHHEDGAALKGAKDEEIQLLPEHMENFYKLFVWCGEQIDTWSNESVQPLPQRSVTDL